MNTENLQLALRELQALMRRPQFWILLGAVGLLMGMVGPFGTFEMPILPRLAYWLTVVVGTSLACFFIQRWLSPTLGKRMPELAAVALGGAVAGVPIAVGVRLFNLAVFGDPDDPMSIWVLMAYTVPIAALVTAATHVLVDADGPGTPATSEVAAPALLERLPHAQRGRLLHIAVSDHYVDVTTDKGTTLVLMRLSDAIRETAPVKGLQVHRSHWVALDAVRRSARQGGKPMLELENGTLVPVSRTYLEAARAAGLLVS